MKPHRQIKASKRVGDPSSEFAYNKNIDEVVNSKLAMIETVKGIIFEEFDDIIINKIQYSDGSVMSQNQKFSIMKEALVMVKEKYDL